ncbi:MAG: SAM-dependent methyltransferase [Bacteroidota bacterium]
MNLVESPEYWSKRYNQNQIGWDCGQITTPLKEYIDQLTDKNIKILIPGCGNAYEGEYLWKKGFKNVYILDFAPEAIQNFKKIAPNFPSENIIEIDFFEHDEKYDLLLEQTFFCAINPNKREAYAAHSSNLLTEKGKLVGVLFNRQFEGGPPFGGNLEEYKNLFSHYFSEVKMDLCYNSIKPRVGTELFIRLMK